jgi:hypothetical protein
MVRIRPLGFQDGLALFEQFGKPGWILAGLHDPGKHRLKLVGGIPVRLRSGYIHGKYGPSCGSLSISDFF